MTDYLSFFRKLSKKCSLSRNTNFTLSQLSKISSKRSLRLFSSGRQGVRLFTNNQEAGCCNLENSLIEFRERKFFTGISQACEGCNAASRAICA